MKITSIRVNKIEDRRVKALVSVMIEDSIVIHGIKIIEEDDGILFVSMPSRRNSKGDFEDIVHPINSATREQLTNAILDEYNK